MRTFLLATVVGVTAAVAQAVPADIESAALMRHIRFLSSDDMKGRANGTPELERAAEYIAEQFRAAGLQPGGRESYFQPFELDAGLTIGRENRLTIERSGRRVSFTLGTSYYPLAAAANNNPETASTVLDDVPVVFAGYGLVAPSASYDDYAIERRLQTTRRIGDGDNSFTK